MERKCGIALTMPYRNIQNLKNILMKALKSEGFIETTAGKGCYVSAQNQDFYLEEQQKKIEEKFVEAIELARSSGIKLDKLINLLTLLYEED